MSAEDTAPAEALEHELDDCVDLIYNAQAVVRVCMEVLDSDSGIAMNENNRRHTVWRALRLADGTLSAAAEKTGDLLLPR